jgi:hypothetical protein
MATLLGIVIVGAVFWYGYVRYARILLSKRYGTKQTEAPDLNQFAAASRPAAQDTADTAADDPETAIR